jgi:uncharacterized membrane protein YgcG
MADHSNFFNGQASIQAAWRYVQAMDKGKFVSTVNEISGNIPKLPVPSAVVAPLDDFYGGISKEFTHQSKDLLTLVGMLLTAVVFAWFMGLLGPAIQLWTLTLALINSLRALESKNPAAIKSMLMYLLVMATFNTAEQTPLALVLHAIPFYGLVKMGFLFLCSVPSTEVSMKVFGAVGRPILVATGGAPPQSPASASAAAADGSATPHSFAVIVKEATIEIAANAADAAYYCIIEAENEAGGGSGGGGGGAGGGEAGGGSSGFRAMTARAQASGDANQPGNLFRFDETLALPFPSAWASSGAALLKVTIMRKQHIGTDSRVGDCAYVLERDSGAESSTSFVDKRLDLPIKDAGQQEIGMLSVEVRG